MSTSRSADSTDLQPLLMMAVAKRLLPRAIDRNRFRRVVREAWRAREWAVPVSSVFVRLMRRSETWRALPDGQLKRAWREEIDRLFAAMPDGDRGVGAAHASGARPADPSAGAPHGHEDVRRADVPGDAR